MNLFDKVIKPLNEELGEAALALNSNSKPPRAPLLYLSSLVASTSIVANCLVSALFTLPTSILVLRNARLRKPLIMVTLFSAIVSLPILFSNPIKFFSFNLRVFSSTSLGLYLISLTGWEGLVTALKDVGLPTEIALALRALPSQLYSFLHDLNTLVIARKARSFNIDYKKLWDLLSTAVGSLLVKGMIKSQRMSMTLKARGMVFIMPKRSAYPTLISSIMLGVSLVGAVLGGCLV